MASVDPEQIDRPDPVEYAKEGVSSAGVSGTAGTAQRAGANTVDSGSTDPIEALSIGAAKGSIKGFATILTKIAADRLGTEEKIKETGDRIEEDILKSVKGIRSQPEQTQDSKEAYDELVVELIKILDKEERFEDYD
ncbi:hypothetical protein [Natronolimnobius sp. AArcel1]|uniref:hypothetical protein n=1 Tax=Natronolimnobius sp. AArcel1 TaxID=1679093 RepID=UPI001F151282|nr:hypothetical protein [Natronolimnobius sp. AArcel1]